MAFILNDGYQRSAGEGSAQARLTQWRDVISDEYVELDWSTDSVEDFQGQIRGGVGIGDLNFSEVISQPQQVRRSKHQISTSTADDFLISFQLSSQGSVRQAGREAILSPGSFAMYDSTRPYTLSFNQPFHQLVLQMPKPVLSQHLLNPEDYTAVPINAQSGVGAVLSNFIFSLAQEANSVEQVPDELGENLLNMIAMAFSSSLKLKQLTDNRCVQDSIKQRVLKFIDNNLSNPELNNTLLAKSHGVSLRYLNKLFQHDEMSLHQLILNKRLNQAEILLADERYKHHSIERIAYSLGYVSPAHFSRSFKSHFGISPSKIR